MKEALENGKESSHSAHANGMNECLKMKCIQVAEEFDGVGEKGSRDTKMVAVQTLLEAFLGISLTSVCSIDEAFF